jgi:hypothetical protein
VCNYQNSELLSWSKKWGVVKEVGWGLLMEALYSMLKTSKLILEMEESH